MRGQRPAARGQRPVSKVSVGGGGAQGAIDQPIVVNRQRLDGRPLMVAKSCSFIVVTAISIGPMNIPSTSSAEEQRSRPTSKNLHAAWRWWWRGRLHALGAAAANKWAARVRRATTITKQAAGPHQYYVEAKRLMISKVKISSSCHWRSCWLLADYFIFNFVFPLSTLNYSLGGAIAITPTTFVIVSYCWFFYSSVYWLCLTCLSLFVDDRAFCLLLLLLLLLFVACCSATVRHLVFMPISMKFLAFACATGMASV